MSLTPHPQTHACVVSHTVPEGKNKHSRLYAAKKILRNRKHDSCTSKLFQTTILAQFFFLQSIFTEQ